MSNIVPENTPQDNPSRRKWCTKGKHWVSFHNFPLNRAKKDGLHQHCKECKNKQAREEYTPERARDVQLRQNYNGFTQKKYDRMFAEQGGVCACCGRPETAIEPRSKIGAIKNLCVDHDHDTGDVRTLLCGECNTSLGHMHEDPSRIQRLKEYAEWCQSRDPDVKVVQLRLVD